VGSMNKGASLLLVATLAGLTFSCSTPKGNPEGPCGNPSIPECATNPPMPNAQYTISAPRPSPGSSIYAALWKRSFAVACPQDHRLFEGAGQPRIAKVSDAWVLLLPRCHNGVRHEVIVIYAG
jgi:hypothetical protein